jgi:RimJ/RimL family protein N-acetyltransferase
MNPDTARSHAPVPGLVELRDGARADAAPLFAALGWHLAVPAVLAGAAAGAVYADAAAAPRSALLLAGHRAYLAGDPANAGFLSVLAAVLEHRFVPQSSESGEFVLYYGSPEWATAVEATIISRLRGYQERRRRYFTRDARADRDLAPAIPLPEGFRLAPVDPVLLDDPALANRDELIEEICSERESVEDFLARSFGIALLHGRSIAGWCLSEYNLGQPCEVGIAVDGQFRRRGLAKELGRAFAQHALGARVNDIGWHCWKDNAASCTTARALGFASVWTYPARWVRLARAGA